MVRLFNIVHTTNTLIKKKGKQNQQSSYVQVFAKCSKVDHCLITRIHILNLSVINIIYLNSVARGAVAPPTAMQNMENTTFLALLRPISALK